MGLKLSPVRVSAPGRICLFGEHQDYLVLPVIAAAINLRITVQATFRDDGLFLIDLPDTEERVLLDASVEQEYAHHRDYLRSCVNVLRREGLRWSHGADARIHGTIPINAGVSSSSAMVVAWLRFLLEAADQPRDATPEDIARWGYQAEVAEFGDPGGMMDHFCAALGGLLRIDTRSPFQASTLSGKLEGIVLGHSLEPKATLETLARNRRDVTDAIAVVRQKMRLFDLAFSPLDSVEDVLAKLPATPARRLRANLVNRDLTVLAADAISRSDSAVIGELLTKHHKELRDGLDLSTPKIERMLNASMEAGALGGKINGSGGGGCMFAYAPGRTTEVAEAIRREGGVPYVVEVDQGVRVETS
jgi:galactokinase